MAGPRKISQEEYDALRSTMEEKYNYSEMSDEKKALFDAEFDKIAVPDKKTDTTDAADDTEDVETDRQGREIERGNSRSRDDDDEFYL